MTTWMRNVAVIACLWLLSGCGTFQTWNDYDVGHDFSAARRVAWAETLEPVESLTAQRFREAVMRTAIAQGLEWTDDRRAAHLLVRAQVRREARQEVRQMPSLGWRGLRGYDHDLYLHDYELEWYLLQFVVPDGERIVWEARAAARASDDLSPAEREARAAEAAAEILRGFPPR